MYIRVGKFLLGVLIIKASIESYTTGPSAFSTATVCILIALLGILLIHGSVKNKEFSQYFNVKRIVVAFSILLVTIPLDYGNAYLQNKPLKEFVFTEHNFSIFLPGEPSISILPPNKFITNGYHFAYENKNSLYLVVYTDIPKSLFNEYPKEKLLPSQLEAIKHQFKLDLSEVKSFKLQNFPAIKFRITKENANFGNGFVLNVHNRLYQVLHVIKNPKNVDTDNDEYIKSFRILHSDIQT